MTVNVNNLRVQIGLNQGPLDDITAITWTDITSSVILSEGINFTTGKTFTDRVARPGTLTLTLDNSAQKGTAGRWTVGGSNRTAGFNLRIPIQVGYYNGSTIDALWTGYIDLLSSRWDGGVRPVVQLTASDRLSRLARHNVGNRYVDEILADSPAGYWPLDDEGGSVALNRGSYNFSSASKVSWNNAGDGDGAILLGVDSPIKFGADSPKVAYSGTTALGNGQYMAAGVPQEWEPSGHFAETFEIMVNPTSITGANTLFGVTGKRDQHTASLSAYIYNGQLYISVDIFAGAYSSSTQQNYVLSAKPVFHVNQWHHVAVTQTSTSSPNSTTVKGYVDGVEVCSMTFSLTGYASPTQFMSQSAQLTAGFMYPDLTLGPSEIYAARVFSGYLSNFAYHSSVLSTTRISEHAKLINGFFGESSASRFNRICGYAGMASGSYSTVGNSQSTMSAQPMVENGSGRSLLTMIEEISDSEVGDVVCLPTGVLAFYARTYRNNPTIAWSVPAQAINADNGFDIDHTEIVNSVRLTNGDGTVANATFPGSITLYDVQSLEANCYVSTTGQLEGIAYGLSRRSPQPKPRLRNIAIDFLTYPTSSSTDPYTILTSDVLDVFRVTGLPTPSSPNSTMTLYIEGWSDRVTESSWQRTLNATQVNSFFNPVWKMDTSTLGNNTILAM